MPPDSPYTSPTANVKALLLRFPDLRISRRIVSRGGRLRKVEAEKRDGPPGEVLTRIEARARASFALARKRARIFLTAAMTAVVVLIAVLQFTEPPSLDARARAFGEAWNGSREAEEAVAGIAAFYERESRENIARQLRRIFEKNGWKEGHPDLAPPEVGPQEGSRSFARFPLQVEGQGMSLQTTWKKDRGGAWHLSGIRFPKGLRELIPE